ncbi:MAG: hypothetical protein KIT58_21235 [Planctomycetota bacterium]|nr:hypothetical protein [Planctomycetota bacterium]
MSALVALILLAQSAAPTLEQVLEALQDDAPVAVSRLVADQALAAAETRRSSGEVEQLLEVAVRAEAFVELGPVLARLIASDGPGLEPALRVAGRLGPNHPHRSPLIKAMPSESLGSPRLLQACQSEDEAVALGAVGLVAAAGPPRAVIDLLGVLTGEERGPMAFAAFQALGARAPSRELFDALLVVAADSGLPTTLQVALADTLSGCVDRAPQLASVLIDAARYRPTSTTLGALKATPPDAWEDAIAVVLETVQALGGDLATLGQADVQLLAAAVGAGGDLRAHPLLDLLPALCQPAAPLPVRMAAVRCLGDLGTLDATIVDVLLTYLGEPPPIGAIAFNALRYRTGAKLPHRPILWREWRKRTDVPTASPAEHADRLAQERQSRYDQRMRAVAASSQP